MASASPTDFGPMIGDVARKLWGEPNRKLSKPDVLRWGNQGARIVYPNTGAFKDTEADLAGGTLDLIQHVQRTDKGGAVRWLVSNGFIADRAPEHAVRLDRGQRIVATFEYRRGGRIHYRKHRIEPGRGDRKKDFAYDHPDGQGGWKWGRGEAEQIPYRLDGLAGADTVLLAEGEAKADRLISWGFSATCSKDWRREFADHVRGKRVVILPDNDSTGSSIATEVRSKIGDAARAILVVSLPRLAEHGDVLDWDGNAEELHGLIEQAADVQPGELPLEETFPVADLELWARTSPTPKAFVMAPFIPRDDVVIVTGDGGTNKSTLALQISACAAAGKQMLGMDVAPGPALYVTAEDDDRENHWRLARIADAIGTNLHTLAGKLHLVSLRGRLNNELATFDHEGALRPTAAYRLLRATIVSTKAKLVTLDNVAHLYAGNENDRGQVTAFINLLYQLCGELGVTILLIAHRNKAGDSYSGSTAWLNAVRSQMLLERSSDLDLDVRKLSLGKANYARQGEEISFRWHDFALVRDRDLAPDVVEAMAATAEAGRDNDIFLSCLRERNRQQRAVSENKASRTYAPKEFAEMAESKSIGLRRLEIAMDRLFRVNAIERGFVWRDTSEGKDRVGLREASGGVPPTSEIPLTPSADLPLTSPPSFRRPPADPPLTTAHTHPYTTYRTGAAHEGPAPAPEHKKPDLARTAFPEPSQRSASGYILAPGETGDEPIPGWGD